MNYWKNKKVLITGGAGLIGSALATNLVGLGARIIILDDLSRGKKEFLKDIAANITFIKVDLTNIDHCMVHIKDVDIVVHMASKVGGIKVYTDFPYSIMNDNITIDSNVIRACLRNKIAKFFYASSAHVYPIALQNNKEERPLIKEEDAYPADPLLTYGWAKLISEQQLLNAAEEFDNFSVAIARYIGIYGLNQDYGLQTGSVIPVFSHRAIKYPEVDFTIWGNGEETRSYCFIQDAVECTKLMIEKMEDHNIVGPYNVGSSDIIKIKDIAQKIVSISKKEIDLKLDLTQKAKILSQWCDCSKIYNELGWKATTSFDQGLQIVYNDVKVRLEQNYKETQ